MIRSTGSAPRGALRRLWYPIFPPVKTLWGCRSAELAAGRGGRRRSGPL